MSNELLKESQPKTFTMDNAPIENCLRCGLEIRQGGHHHILMCYSDLKKALEREKKKSAHLLEVILNNDSKELNHLTKSINFQIHKIQSFIQSSTTPEDFAKLQIFVVELVHTGRELQKLLQL